MVGHGGSFLEKNRLIIQRERMDIMMVVDWFDHGW